MKDKKKEAPKEPEIIYHKSEPSVPKKVEIPDTKKIIYHISK